MQKKQNISDRISEIIAYHNLSVNRFAIKLGYNRAQSVYDIVNGKVMPSYDFFYKFACSELSENINLRWLITGDETMLTDPGLSTLKEPDITYGETSQKEALWINYLQQKDNKMIEMAEEIGRLRSHIRELSNSKQKKDDTRHIR